jgi:hypothetical protein
MGQDYVIPITETVTVKDTGNVDRLVKAAVITGNYYLRVSPYSSNTYTGSHIGNGFWKFTAVEDAVYELWDASTKVESFGRRYIGDGTISADIVDSGTLNESRLPTGINANKIGAGNVDNTEYGYLDGVTSALQTQLNNKVSKTGVETVAGKKTFSDTITFAVDTSLSPAKYPQISVAESPVSDLHLVPLFYFNLILASITGIIQSARCIYCLPDRTADTYSKKSLEACVLYLQGISPALTSKYRGLILIHPSHASGNELVAGGSLWFGNYIDILSFGLTKISLNNSGNSLTGDCVLTNIRLTDSSEKSTMSFTNFTFNNVEIDNTLSNFTFNNCVFNSIKIKGNATVSLVGCKGNGVYTNCDVTTSGGSMPTNIHKMELADLF